MADWKTGDFKHTIPWVSVVARLILMPIIAVIVVNLLTLTTNTARALVLQIAMPVAVNALVLAQEFDAVPNQVGHTIALSTLGALVTIPLWLVLITHLS